MIDKFVTKKLGTFTNTSHPGIRKEGSCKAPISVLALPDLFVDKQPAPFAQTSQLAAFAHTSQVMAWKTERVVKLLPQYQP